MSISDYNTWTPYLKESYAYKINRPGSDYMFKPANLPFIGQSDLQRWVTDADMKKLEKAMVEDTYVHRHQSFWRENVAVSSVYMVVSIIKGEGLSISVDTNEEAKKIIEDWNDEINVKHQSIEDLIADAYIDNIINAESLWRIYVDINSNQKVDLQRVPMKNVKKYEHETRGWECFVQTATIPKRSRSEKVFYRHPIPGIRETETIQTLIPHRPNCCLYFNFFQKPPVSTVLHILVYKKWITWFMRKYAEKFWAPFLIGYVGDPKNGYMPPNKKDRDDSLRFMARSLKKVRDFGVGAFMATTSIDVLDTKSSKNSDVYVNYLEYLNKEIGLGLFSSMSLREGSGREKATSDIVQQGQLRYIRGIRESFSVKLRKFYAQVLLPAYGINDVKPTDIKVDWPPIKLENVKDILQAVEIGAKIGAFRDAKEIRKILTPIWRHIDENISEAEVKELKQTFLEMNSPSRAEGDSPQSRAGNSVKTNKGQP